MSAGTFAFAMNVPTLICLGLILVYPLAYAAYLSVHKVGLAQLRRGEFPFTGWENYGRVFEDPLFWSRSRTR
jgi:ABC-type sugar transport system permease subunit